MSVSLTAVKGNLLWKGFFILFLLHSEIVFKLKKSILKA